MSEILNAYIVLEGIDGSGKTVQSNRLTSMLSSEFRNAHVMRVTEPSAGPVGRALRDRLMGAVPLPAWEALGLFVQDRRSAQEELRSMVTKINEAGISTIIVSDRSYISTLVYQGGEPGCPSVETLWAVHGESWMLPIDHAFLLDVPVETALARIASRGRPSSFEVGQRLEVIRQRYLACARREPPWLQVVEGDAEQSHVTHTLYRIAAEVLARKGMWPGALQNKKGKTHRR